MMTLFHSPTSPYVRKVMIVLHETGLIDRVTLTPGNTTPLEPNPALQAANPLGKVPCLVRDDGPALFDSTVICRYLDTLHGGHKFYPAGAAEFASLTLESLADGMLDAGVMMVYEERFRPAEIRFAPWVEAQKTKILKGIDALEHHWLAHLAGPVDIGAVAVAAALGWIDLRFSDLGWRDSHPGLAKWHAGFAARDSYKATVPVV